MKLQIYDDYRSLSEGVAAVFVDQIQQKPDSVICVASGHTPRGVFEQLRGLASSGKADFSKCQFIGLDEWIGVPADNPGSCRAMLDNDFFLPLDIPTSNIFFFDGMDENPDRQVKLANSWIADRGGIDVMLVGIGLNGHIGMNEPGTSFGRGTHVATLSASTVTTAQKYFNTHTEVTKGITLGLADFRKAKVPILMASGAAKRDIISIVLTQEPDTTWPASVVQQIPDARVMIDKACAPNIK